MWCNKYTIFFPHKKTGKSLIYIFIIKYLQEFILNICFESI